MNANDSSRNPVVAPKKPMVGRTSVPQAVVKNDMPSPANMIQMLGALAHPQLLQPVHIRTLQRTAGNRAVQRFIQCKLTVGAANDQYEQEADRVADQVMNTSTTEAPIQRNDEDEIQTKPLAATITPLVQRQVEEEEEIQTKRLVQRQVEEEEEIQTKRLVQRQVEEEEEIQTKRLVQRQEDEEEIQTKRLVQRQEDEEDPDQRLVQRQEDEEEIQTKPVDLMGRFDAGDDFERTLDSTRGGGAPMPDSTRSFMERRFGSDFGGVRIHADNTAAQLNRTVSAAGVHPWSRHLHGPRQVQSRIQRWPTAAGT